MNTYLIQYGADNEFWLCQADDKEHALEQFASADMDGEVNHVYLCTEV